MALISTNIHRYRIYDRAVRELKIGKLKKFDNLVSVGLGVCAFMIVNKSNDFIFLFQLRFFVFVIFVFSF